MTREINVKSGDVTALTKEKFNSNKVRKDTLSSWLQEAAEIMERQIKIISTLKNTMYVLKTELIEDKTEVSEAQGKSRMSNEISFLF
jgi:thiamine kinase-like enzyme